MTDGSIVPRDAATDRAMHKLNLHFILPGKLPLPIVLDPSTGNGAGNFMVVGPKWQGETPAGIRKVLRSSTEFSMGTTPKSATPLSTS